MKKRMILAMLLVAATVQVSMAQSDKPEHPRKAKHEHKTEAGERKHSPVQFIAKELKLNEEQTAAFAPVYAEYRKALRGDKPEQPQKFNPAEADDSQMLEHLNKWLDREIRTATVRKEYVDKFLTVLTPKQLAKLYRLESSFGKGGRNQHGPQHGPQGRPGHGAPNGHPGHAPQHRHGGPAPK